MNLFDFNFFENISSTKDIYSHLKKCSDLFTPPLNNYINLKDYSEKIRNNAETIECWYNNELIGLVAIYLNDIDCIEGYITNVSTVEEYQNLGISSKLILKALEKAKRKNLKKIKLEVFKDNKVAIKFYQKHNFKISKIFENKLLMVKLF